MNPSILYSGIVHLLPETFKKIEIENIEGLYSLTFEASYNEALNGMVVHSELRYGDEYKYLQLLFNCKKNVKQRSVIVETISSNKIIKPITLELYSESETIFALKVFGI
jgi:hypothetical protein